MSNFLVNIFSISLIVSLAFFVHKVFSALFLKRYGAGLKQLLWVLVALRMLVPITFASVWEPIDDYIVAVDDTSKKHFPNSYRNLINTFFHEDLSKEIDSKKVEAFPVMGKGGVSSNVKFKISTWKENVSEFIGKIILLYQENILLIFCIYLGGVLVFLLFHCLLYVYTCWRINRNAYPLDSKMCDALIKRIYDEYEPDINADVYVTDCIVSPMIMSISDTTIYLPKSDYSHEELDAILRHEFMHLKHKDLIIKRLYLFANALHWFNPLSYFIFKDAVKDMELYCDEGVVKQFDLDKRNQYNDILLGFLEDIGGFAVKHKFFTTSYQGNVEEMKQRFLNNLDMKTKKTGILPMIVLSVLLLVTSTFIALDLHEVVASTEHDYSVDLNLPFYDLSDSENDIGNQNIESEEMVIYDRNPDNLDLKPEKLSDGRYMIPVISESAEDFLYVQKFIVSPNREAIEKIPEIEVYFDYHRIPDYGVTVNQWPEKTSRAEDNQFYIRQIDRYNEVYDIADCYSSERSSVDVVFPNDMVPDVVQVEDFILDENGLSKYPGEYHELVYHNPIIDGSVRFYMNGHIAFNSYEPVYNVVMSTAYYRGINMCCYWVTDEGIQSATYMFIIGNKNLEYNGAG